MFPVCFIAGFVIAVLLWEYIQLPFSNPWQVIGSYTVIEMNPNSETLRFLVVLGLPMLFIFIGHLFLRNEKPNLQPQVSVYQQVNSVPWLVLCVVFSVVFALNIGIEKHLFDYFHDGESLGPAISFYAGQTPYKDYLFLHGFFQDPFRSVLAFELFGRGISSLEIMDGILKIINSGLLFFLVYRLFRFNKIALTAMVLILVFLGISNRIWTRVLYDFVPVINHQGRDICTFSFLILLTYLFDQFIAKKPDPKKVVFISLLLYLVAWGSYLYSVDRAYYLSATSLVVGVIVLLFGNLSFKRSFLVGAIPGMTMAIHGFILVIGTGIPYFLDYYFLKLPGFKELVDGIPYDINGFPFLVTLVLIALPVCWLAHRFFYAAIFSNGNIKENIGEFARHYFLEIILATMTVFYFRSALGRSDYYHLAYVSVLIYLLFFYFLFRRVLRPLFDRMSKKRMVAQIAFVAIGLIGVVGFFRLFSNNAYLLRANFPIGIADEIYLKDDYEQMIELIKETLSEDEHFYTLTNELCWYYFIDKPAPSRHHLINFTSPYFFQEELIQDLEKNNVKLILYNNEDPFNHFDNVGFRDRVPLVTDYVHEHYMFFRQIGRQELWIRKGVE